MANLLSLGGNLHYEILSYLDRPSRVAFVSTCSSFLPLSQNTLISLPPSTQTTRTVTGHVTFATPLSSDSDSETLASTNTELSRSPDEDVWEFKQNPELMTRVHQLHHESTSITTLPAELQIHIFSYLDKIDACCLGLSCARIYGLYRDIHGTKMPLNTRRPGPNPFEAAWEIVGKRECMHCGIYRCELHQHIKSWMPEELEYCSMKQNFGLPAETEAKPSCFRGKPSKPHRCGRHPSRTTSMHQDDVAV